jgi:hypothetical protein
MTLGEVQQPAAAIVRPGVRGQRLGDRALGRLEPSQFLDSPCGNSLSALAIPFPAHSASCTKGLRAACQRIFSVDFVTDRI